MKSMWKIAFADDEPLVLVGLRSMVDWDSIGVEIVGSAQNGEELLSIIKEKKPDVVISDIKMPLLTGLEVMQKCRSLSMDLPLFILLTSYTEFPLVQNALRLSAVEYLVKIDLTSEMLTQAVHRALSKVSVIKEQRGRTELPSSAETLQMLQDRFFIRLLHGLVESKEQVERQCQDLGLDISAKHFRAACLEMKGNERGSRDEAASLYSSTLRILSETLSHYAECRVFLLDLRHAAVIFFLKDGEGDNEVSHALNTAFLMAYNYFTVVVSGCVGPVVDDLFSLDESFALASSLPSGEKRQLVFANKDSAMAFDFSPYKERLASAFGEMDASVLEKVLLDVAHAIETRQVSSPSALSAVSNILYMATTMLPDGEEMVRKVDEREGKDAGWISSVHSPEEYGSYLESLAHGLSGQLLSRRQDYRAKVVQNVQSYIKENVSKRLSLMDVASVFGFSQNYLSSLFSKFGEMGFVEYTTKVKVDAAKELLLASDCKIYEVAQKLGFDNAFYFSKVFKKQEGISPREYVQKMTGRTYNQED